MNDPATAVAVCGFGRCGSTMAMAMLAAGGLAPVDGSGSPDYELDTIEPAYSNGPDYFVGHAVKLLDSVLFLGVPSAPAWRFVWMDRDSHEQARSQVKLMEWTGLRLRDDAVDLLVASMAVERPRALGLLRAAGDVTVVRYEDVLANPYKGAKQLRKVFPALDLHAATAAVHHRDGGCLPDLVFEFGAS